MSTLAKLVLATAAGLLVGVPVAVGIGARYQARTLESLSEALVGAVPPEVEAGADYDDLPTPVARYLAWALPDGKQLEMVRLSQFGALRTDARSERWMRFEAEHLVVPPVTGFVWNARVSIAPLLHVRVRDALVAGRGSGHVTLLSAFTVGADAGTPEMNAGSAHRFLAEAVWYPSALLPSDRLAWTPIDETRALATLRADGNEVSLEFRFGASGEVIGIYTPGRWGTFAEGYEQVPWEGHFSDYQLQNGVRFPMNGEVGWHIDGEWKAVWRGTVSAVTFGFDG